MELHQGSTSIVLIYMIFVIKYSVKYLCIKIKRTQLIMTCHLTIQNPIHVQMEIFFDG